MNDLKETPLRLASRGLPCFSINTSPTASSCEEYAAEELRRHLQMMIGAGTCSYSGKRSRGPEATGQILLNDWDTAAAAGVEVAALELGPEGFHLESRGNQLHILGGGPRGVLYGVYDLLETLGWRWFTPGVTRQPRCRQIVLPPVKKTAGPAFEFRDMWVWEGSDPLWWSRNRMNGQYTVVPEYMGGHVKYGLFVHTFYTLLPPAEFFAAHPEYYSLIDGQRRHETAQLCLTNPDVLRLVIERVLDCMAKHPQATIFSVSQNDWRGYCECPACSALAAQTGSQAGPLLQLVNAVAEAAGKVYPDKLIDTLAYQYTLDAPSGIKPHPNVRIRLCPICCCQGHAFGTCEHPESKRFLTALERWAQLTPQLYIWHYCTNFANYLFPMPDFDEISENIKLYQNFGVHGIFMQGMGEEGGGGESMALRGYVISKLLWNPDQPVWPLVDEFLAGYYGRAAAPVRGYLELFHERVRKNNELHPSLYDPASHPLFAGEICDAADALLAGGEAKVQGRERRGIRLLRGGLSYQRVTAAAVRFKRQGDIYQGDGSGKDRDDFDRLVRELKQSGIRRLREGHPLELTADLLGKRLGSHQVYWLRDDANEIALVPTLGGRLLEWHAHGRQWLAQADPGNQWLFYPMSEGYAEYVFLGEYYSVGWSETYRYRAGGPQGSATLQATLANGLRLKRSCRLATGCLTIRSVLENTGSDPVSAGWGAGLYLELPGAEAVSFKTANETRRLTVNEIPDGVNHALVFEGPNAPANAWVVELPGFRVSHEFRKAAITRAILGRDAARNTIALDIRTARGPLAPGEKIEAVQKIRITPV